MAEWTPILKKPLLAKGSYKLTSRSYVLMQSLVILHIWFQVLTLGVLQPLLNSIFNPSLAIDYCIMRLALI